MANVPNGVETLPTISIAGVGRTNVTDRRQSDGRTTAKKSVTLNILNSVMTADPHYLSSN